MTAYLRTVTRRLSELALQRGDDPIEKPARVRADVRVVLTALRDAEVARLSDTNAKVERPQII